MKVELYIASHKKVEVPDLPPEYILIHGGAALSGKEKNEVGDDTELNISTKNLYYNELTVLYWAWKNRMADIKGICHYRRYFSKSNVTHNSRNFICAEDIIKDLNNCDIIMHDKSCHRGMTVKECYMYGNDGLQEDIDIFREIISECYPEYCESFDKIFNGYLMSFYNMFICKSELFDAYCEWLFDVLKIAENKFEIEKREGSQKRVLAYMAERLLNVWVEKNKLRVKYYPVIKIDSEENRHYSLKILLDKMGIFSIYKYFRTNYYKYKGEWRLK